MRFSLSKRTIDILTKLGEHDEAERLIHATQKALDKAPGRIYDDYRTAMKQATTLQSVPRSDQPLQLDSMTNDGRAVFRQVTEAQPMTNCFFTLIQCHGRP